MVFVESHIIYKHLNNLIQKLQVFKNPKNGNNDQIEWPLTGIAKMNLEDRSVLNCTTKLC